MERPDGSVIDFAAVALPDGNMLFTYVDVTDSVGIERALRERNQALEAADQLKSEFLASVSYELRTPLNVIIGFAEVLVNQYFGGLNERQLEYSRDILNSSQQLLSLINDILDLASIEAGRLELDVHPVEARVMLESVLALARERAQRRQLQLQLECPDDAGIVELDEKRIKQALFNLISNSLKYTDPGGQIAIGAQRQGEEIEFYVADNGIGIDEDDRRLVFESFQRGRKGNAEHSAGLGLALVKSFVELHQGRVLIESEVGVGTRVSMVLPGRQTVIDHPARRLRSVSAE
jgi:signal transduction histidine kinase